MSKLITLKDDNTQNPIYPTTLINNVIDENGSNISGFIEKEIEKINSEIIQKTAKIKQVENSIKTLKGETKNNIPKNVTQIEINKNNLTDITNKLNDAQEKLIATDLSKIDIYNNSNVCEVLEYLNETIDLIEFGTPTTAPKRKKIMIDDNNLYIGICNKWFVVEIKEFLTITVEDDISEEIGSEDNSVLSMGN